MRCGRFGCTSSSIRRVVCAMLSAPRRDLMNAMVLTRAEIRFASRSDVSAMTVRREGAPFSPFNPVSCGSQKATVVEPCGEQSWSTARAGAPISLLKDAAGAAEVADAPMNTGCAP